MKTLVTAIKLLPFDAEAADQVAKITGSLRRLGKPVNALNAMIAGYALADGASRLISFDEDFSKIGEVCDRDVRELRRS